MTSKRSIVICNTQEQCLAVINDININIQDVRSTYELVRLPGAEIANENNKKVVVQMIVDLNRFVNTARTMNEYQIGETIKMMYREYPNLTLQEYQYFFNKIKAGYFGQLYESMDGIKIMAFLKQFYEEILRSYNDKIDGSDYQRKVDQGCRDIDTWTKY